MLKYVCVVAGGGAGALLRYLISVAIALRFPGRFPAATFLINVSGSFLIGLLMSLFTARVQLNPNWRLLLVTGVLGGYTTFSSFEYEVLALGERGAPLMAFVYVLASIGAGYLAVWFGAFLVSRILPSS